MANGKEYIIPEKKANFMPSRRDWIELEPKKEGFEDDFRLVATYEILDTQDQKMELVAKLSDLEGYEYIEFERLGGKSHVYLNDELIGTNTRWSGRVHRGSIRPYRFYTNFKKGENVIRIECEYGNDDIPVVSGYVKVGKIANEPWQVKLHYGKARVFVKSNSPKDLELKVKLK